MKGLCSLKDVIIKDGIKYTLYLLCFYLFDAISWIFRRSKETCYENHERENRCKEMKNKKSNDKPLIEPQNAEKDSDSSRNQSSNASNETTINMPMNYKNIDSCISHTTLKKPIDISTEKHSFNKTFANKRSNVTQNKFPKSYTQKQRSNFVVNKVNARIFNQKFTSSDNMHSSLPRSFASQKCGESKQTNFFYDREDSKFSNSSLTKFAPTNEKKKKKHAPTKYKSYYSRIPVRNKKSKQINMKHKEMGTQTDSAFSTDNAVQMVSVGTMWPEQEIDGNATHKSQVKLQLLFYFPYDHSII